MKRFLLLSMVFSCLLIVSCTNTETPSEPTVPQTPSIAFSIAATLPHDTSDFTEGLEFYKGMLMESTGLEGKSRIVQYDPSTGKVVQQISIDPKQFGEGISVFKDTVYQLTYQHNLVNVYTVKGLRRIKELPFKGEGWGLTHDSTYLIATNGGNKLLYFEAQTFKPVKEVEVKEGNTPAVNLNEVEYVNGFIYANQWQYNTILKIDPATGNVVAKMDLSSVEQREKAENGRAGVLNGIAYNPETKKFYVTGKNWAKIYELKLDL